MVRILGDLHGSRNRILLVVYYLSAAVDHVDWREEAADEVADRAVAHGDEHVIKFTEACLSRHALGPSPVYFAAANHVLGMIPRR